ncbi:hypothetical protein [Hydrogenophaga sp.]|uniref:hypothetical protein n=1 Tax=Hydrogenophaga sp. TaxID=1904254 RepID=UPI00286E460B|nr:hypothetical protein [Hydrogenophaga sp.]
MKLSPLAHHRPRSAHRRLVQAGVLVCGVVAGLLEFWALQRRRLVGRDHAGVNGP